MSAALWERRRLDVQIVRRAARDLAGGCSGGGFGEGVFVANAAELAGRFLRERIFFGHGADCGCAARYTRSTCSQTERNEDLCVGWPRAANQGYQSRRGSSPSKTRSLRGWVMVAKRPERLDERRDTWPQFGGNVCHVLRDKR